VSNEHAGRVTLVSGASRGIGRAIARELAARGARVGIGWHRDEDGANQAVSEIAAQGGSAISVRLDQTDDESIGQTIAQVTKKWGPIASFVANAVEWPSHTTTETASLARSLTTNVVGTFTVIESLLPSMRSDGWGRILVVSSDIVAQPTRSDVAYAAAKGSLEAIAHVLAVREAQYGILTNIVRPGFTMTEKTAEAAIASVAREAQSSPTLRVSVPEDVASVAAYLASEANTHLNGQTISVTGGRELQR
jgi:NAD(P)-dependent dehydrogenase (short-subunit alcohol dehydrogenase family)